MKRTAGFTLIEALVGLALALFIFSTGVEFFGLAARAFFRLRAREEAGQAALAALDRIRIDLLHAGRGLAAEMAAGLLEAARADAAGLRTVSAERSLALASDVVPGATRLALVSTAGIAAGAAIALRDGPAAEVRTVVGLEPGAARLDAPVAGRYSSASAAVSLLESVTYSTDAARILRRRVNGGSAQPLLEDVRTAVWTYDPETHLARVRLEVDVEGADPHEATIFIKNAALAQAR
ncbi:MAG TPA: type II secretion system protein [Acidobacteriota bacterium]|nr:type II secretion system protein [Acidobacteriota bacterium]